MQPHQERVVMEKAELDGKVIRLHEFLKGPVFAALPTDEQERLTEQFVVMQRYSSILGERIAAF